MPLDIPKKQLCIIHAIHLIDRGATKSTFVQHLYTILRSSNTTQKKTEGASSIWTAGPGRINNTNQMFVYSIICTQFQKSSEIGHFVKLGHMWCPCVPLIGRRFETRQTLQQQQRWQIFQTRVHHSDTAKFPHQQVTPTFFNHYKETQWLEGVPVSSYLSR